MGSGSLVPIARAAIVTTAVREGNPGSTGYAHSAMKAPETAAQNHREELTRPPSSTFYGTP
jgi:hypothetical protein